MRKHQMHELMVHFTIYMCRVLPKLMPLCVAPLFEPYCREITFCPARICSSLKFRTFLSDSFGPIEGCPNVCAYSNICVRVLRYRYNNGMTLNIYLSAKRLQANNDRIQVLTFPQINALECLLWWHAQLFWMFQESCGIKTILFKIDSEWFKMKWSTCDVFHTLEGHLSFIYFFDWTGFNDID